MNGATKDLSTNKEFRIIRAMKLVLLDVIKDTTVEPGMRHPLSERTIDGIRHCLALISARENELGKEAGLSSQMRPYFIDDPQKHHTVSITSIKSKTKKKNDKD